MAGKSLWGNGPRWKRGEWAGGGDGRTGFVGGEAGGLEARRVERASMEALEVDLVGGENCRREVALGEMVVGELIGGEASGPVCGWYLR